MEEKKALEAIKTLLAYIGEDPEREGLKDTPKRFLKAWKEHWGSGYGKELDLKVFEDGGQDYDQMVVIENIRVQSHCEHHLAPIIGQAKVAYIPNGKIVGLSKINRLVDLFSRRLQVQERLTSQIADTLMKELNPLGVGVIIKADHYCVRSRGILDENSFTITSALRGKFRTDEIVRKEFLKL